MTLVESALRKVHEALSESRYLPGVERIDGPSAGRFVVIRGKKCVNFAVNGYLGLADHPRVKEAASKAALTYGAGAGASRWTGGTLGVHAALEEAVARFKYPDGSRRAVLFSAGYLANIGAIPAIAVIPLLTVARRYSEELRDTIGHIDLFADRENHRCILDGCLLAQAWGAGRVRVRTYRHLDTEHLQLLLRSSDADRKLILTDGIFSLSGRVAPLAAIANLAREHRAAVYLDDAHGTGVLGDQGRGTAELLGVEAGIAFSMGTFSKAFGGAGGYMVVEPSLAEYLRYSSPSYLFQTAMPPSVAAGILEAISISEGEEGRMLRRRLSANVAYLHALMAEAGLDTMGSSTHIVPVLIGEESLARSVADELKDRGFYAPCYYHPAVPRRQGIVRVNVMASHERRDLDALVESLTSILGRRHRVRSDDAQPEGVG